MFILGYAMDYISNVWLYFENLLNIKNIGQEKTKDISKVYKV